MVMAFAILPWVIMLITPLFLKDVYSGKAIIVWWLIFVLGGLLFSHGFGSPFLAIGFRMLVALAFFVRAWLDDYWN